MTRSLLFKAHVDANLHASARLIGRVENAASAKFPWEQTHQELKDEVGVEIQHFFGKPSGGTNNRSTIRSRIFTQLVAMIIFCLVSATTSVANDPTIRVQISSDEVFVGDSFDCYVTIDNAKAVPTPDMTAVKESFDVVPTGNESRNQSSIVNINGRITRNDVLSHIYRYRLTPKTAGDLTIPPVTAVVDEKTISSSEFAVRVIEPEKQDLVLIELETSHQRVYPTQPFTVTVRIFVQPLPSNSDDDPLYPVRSQPPHLQLNWVDIPAGLKAEETNRWLQPLMSEEGSGFTLNEVMAHSNSFFDSSRPAVFGFSKNRQLRESLKGKSIRYHVYELARTFTPEKSGEYVFGPASVKGTFVSGIEKRKAVARRLVAIAPSTTVQVREVPLPRPATFCGGIGAYKITASASPEKLRVGDPLTLTLEFERGPQSGSLELISAPDLSAIPQLMDDFEIVDKNPTGRVEGSSKKFAYAMRPKRPNAAIPSLQIATFDPSNEEFVDFQTGAIRLDVTEAIKVTAGDLVGSMPSSTSSIIKSRAQGIFQNITDLSDVRDESISILRWSEVTGGLWCTVGLLLATITFYRRKSSDAGWIRRQQAKKAAHRKLNEARNLLAQGKQKESLGQVRAAIVGLVADMTNRIFEGLTTTNVITVLTEASVREEERTAVLKLLESIESAEYGAGYSSDPAAILESAATIISQIYPSLERGI